MTPTATMTLAVVHAITSRAFLGTVETIDALRSSPARGPDLQSLQVPRSMCMWRAFFIGVPILLVLLGGLIALLVWGASRGPTDAERLAVVERAPGRQESPRSGDDLASEFEVESRWKEQVIYWEGRDGFVFDAGWGVDPPVLYVPSAQDWDRVTAGWMAGRHDLIVARLTERSGHRVEVGAYEPRPASHRMVR